MSEKEDQSVSTAEVFEEARKYTSSQRRALIEELATDIRNLSHSIVNLYDEHKGVFLMHGVQVEVKFSVFNEVAYKQVLGCPEFYDKMSEMAEEVKEARNDQRTQTCD